MSYSIGKIKIRMKINYMQLMLKKVMKKYEVENILIKFPNNAFSQLIMIACNTFRHLK